MSSQTEQDVLGQAIVNFSRDGIFPEEDEVSATSVQSSALPGALNALGSAQLGLEHKIRNISSESAPEVDAWIRNAKALQEDIEGSRSLAGDIVREAEAGDALNQTVKDAEDRLEFLSKEAKYSEQVSAALQGIKNVRDLLDQAEQAAVERKILAALHILSSAWDVIYAIPANARTRAIRLLDGRAFALRASIHENFSVVWNSLVNIDADSGTVTIQKDAQVDTMDISSAITTMEAYKEMEERVEKFSESLEDVIIRPRIDLKVGSLPSIVIQGNTLRTSTVHADRTIKSLFLDLGQIVIYLNKYLPVEFTRPLSKTLMPKLCSQIKETWLDSAVPTSLNDMTAFRKAIALVQVFADNLEVLQWTGAEELHDWVANAPRIWLTKRRETCLDWTRNQLSLGVGNPRKVDRVETQTISRNEGKHIAHNGNANGSDWDAAWSDEEQDKSLSGQDKGPSGQQTPSDNPDLMAVEHLNDDNGPKGSGDDDEADAWGWGDDEPVDASVTIGQDESNIGVSNGNSPEKVQEAVREMTLVEKYTISSMPDPVFKTIASIIEDGATLTQEVNEQNPVTAAAVGLFALPTLVLAMYRAVSPYYYTLSSGGNMYLYNDAMWLAEQLRDFVASWATREDLNPRAHGKVKLDNEIKALEKFGKRAYGNEMSTQRTILNDLLGGSQNFLHHEGQSQTDDEIAIDSVVSHIRSLSSGWKQILSKSAWAQATGSLLSTVAKKVILDVQDLTYLGAEEAYRVANLISKIVELDDLFLPENKEQPQIPVTSQYAPNWLKLHFLSEVLQSDLKDVKYLWFESDLSLYFTAEEVVDLVKLSFEKNFRTREVIASIGDNPQPRGVTAEDL